MAVTQWAVLGPGVTPGRPHAMPGIVVNGSSEGGHAPDPLPEHGRERPPGRR